MENFFCNGIFTLFLILKVQPINTKTIAAWTVLKLWEKYEMVAFTKRFPLSSNSSAYISCRMWNEKSTMPARGDNFAVDFGLRGSWRSHYNQQTCKLFVFVYKYLQMNKVTSMCAVSILFWGPSKEVSSVPQHLLYFWRPCCILCKGCFL